ILDAGTPCRGWQRPRFTHAARSESMLDRTACLGSSSHLENPGSAGGTGDADRAGQTVGAVVAVPVRVLRVGQVLLVVVLGVVVPVQPADLGRDRPVPAGTHHRL